MPIGPGDRVGRYDVLAPLGSGGMGDVYRARDLRLERDVALKVIARGSTDGLAAARFEQEARLLAALRHPNVVAVYDVGEHEGQPFIVSELLEGHTLRERLGRGLPDAQTARAWALQLANALSAAHDRGIVHRDLKPENVFIDRDEQLKVIDFGIATDQPARGGTLADGARALTAEGAVLGTPGYMSPEQLRGEPADARSDVFSLGCVLHEMLAGQKPFPGRTPGEAAARVLGDPPGPLPASAPKILRAVAARCLRKDPRQRFQTARDVVTAIEAGLEPAAVLQPALLLAGALAALVLALLAYGALRPGRQGPGREAPSATLAVLPFIDLSAARDLGYLGDGMAEELINVLGHARGLRIAGRSSSFAVRDAASDAREVGRRLNVGALVEGSVRRAGTRVRITAQLIDASNGYQLWSETFEKELGEAFALQDDVSAAVAAAIKAHLLGAAVPRSSHEYRPASAEAYTQFLLGRRAYVGGSLQDHQRAQEFWRKAVALDPNYARAWAGLAIVAASIPLKQGSPRGARDEGASEGVRLADRAIALAPELAEGYAARAQIRALYLHEWEGGLADYERALALGPFDDDVIISYATWGLMPLGRLQEAITTLQKAAEDEPLNPACWLFLGQAQTAVGNFEAARAALARAREVKGLSSIGWFEAVNAVLAGREAEAREAAARAAGPWKTAALALLGDDAALAGVREPFLLAQVLAFRGRRDEALLALEHAADEHDDSLSHLQASALLAPLRGDPRYGVLLERLRLPRAP